MIEWLNGEIEFGTREETYRLVTALTNYEVRQLIPDNAWIVLNWDDEKHWLKFAVLQFYTTDSDSILTTCIFHGEGPSGNLRECRHTYWGEHEHGDCLSAYMPYPNGPAIRAAFKVLSEFYDDMI